MKCTLFLAASILYKPNGSSLLTGCHATYITVWDSWTADWTTVFFSLVCSMIPNAKSVSTSQFPNGKKRKIPILWKNFIEKVRTSVNLVASINSFIWNRWSEAHGHAWFGLYATRFTARRLWKLVHLFNCSATSLMLHTLLHSSYTIGAFKPTSQPRHPSGHYPAQDLLLPLKYI